MMFKPFALFLSCTVALSMLASSVLAEGMAADPAAVALADPLTGELTGELTGDLAVDLSDPPDCARLAAEAGTAEGLPDGLLPAISLVETGKGDGQGGRMPWPWTLNQGGTAHYLDSKAEALAKRLGRPSAIGMGD